MKSKRIMVGFAGYPQAGKDTAADALEALGFKRDSLAAPLKEMAMSQLLNSDRGFEFDARIPGTVFGHDGEDEVYHDAQVRELVEEYGWELAKGSYHWRNDKGDVTVLREPVSDPEPLGYGGIFEARTMGPGGLIPEDGFSLGRGQPPVNKGGYKKVYPVRERLQMVGDLIGDTLGPLTLLDSLLRRIENEEWVVITDVRREEEARELSNAGVTLVWVNRPGLEPVNDHPLESGMAKPFCSHTIDNKGSKYDLRAEAASIVVDEILRGLS